MSCPASAAAGAPIYPSRKEKKGVSERVIIVCIERALASPFQSEDFFGEVQSNSGNQA